MNENIQDNQYQLLVNMPDCTNLQFTFDNGLITKSKRIPDKNANDSILYYKLSDDIQNKIMKYLNPKAIF